MGLFEIPHQNVNNTFASKWSANFIYCWLGPLIKVLLIDKVSWCKYYSLLVQKLFYSQASTQLQILWRVLTNDCSHRHSSPESTCVYSPYCYCSPPDHSQQTIRGTLIRSNRGSTSTATKINVKQRDEKGFTLQQYVTTIFLYLVTRGASELKLIIISAIITDHRETTAQHKFRTNWNGIIFQISLENCGRF